MRIVINSISLLFLVLTSCGSTPEKEVEAITKDFAESFYNMDYENALKLSTSQSALVISFFASNITQEYIDRLKQVGSANVEIINAEMGEYGTTATVRCKITNCIKINFIEESSFIKKESEEIFYLIKSGDKWFVDFHH